MKVTTGLPRVRSHKTFLGLVEVNKASENYIFNIKCGKLDGKPLYAQVIINTQGKTADVVPSKDPEIYGKSIVDVALPGNVTAILTALRKKITEEPISIKDFAFLDENYSASKKLLFALNKVLPPEEEPGAGKEFQKLKKG